MDRCFLCRGRVTPKRIEHLHRWGDIMVLVKGLPAEVCENCNEVYLPPASLRLLDDLMRSRDAPTEFIQVPVYAIP